LAGNRYASPEDFVNDVAIVFANAIKFNKDGRDVGDPLSCAYYDASIHLLRYIRWLSLELLSENVKVSEHVDEPEDDGLPLISWELSTGNKKKAREEMEAIVLKEPIEKSLEGDRYTWMEAECEKLLKALRHISDNRYMSYFLHVSYQLAGRYRNKVRVLQLTFFHLAQLSTRLCRFYCKADGLGTLPEDTEEEAI
jgi:hypothetical protein